MRLTVVIASSHFPLTSRTAVKEFVYSTAYRRVVINLINIFAMIRFVFRYYISFGTDERNGI
jgi:hypothetical protein